MFATLTLGTASHATFSIHGGADELLLAVQPVVALNHASHGGRQVVFEDDLARPVAASIDLAEGGQEVSRGPGAPGVGGVVPPSRWTSR